MDMPSFLLPANGQATPMSIARKRQLANALMQQGMDVSPLASPWQAAARVAQGLVGGLDEHRADTQEQQGISSANQALAAALQGKDPNAMAMAFNNPYVTPQAASMANSQWERANPSQLDQLRMQTEQAQLDQLQHPTMTPYQQAEVAAEQQRLELEKANKGGSIRPLTPEESAALSGGYIDRSGNPHLPTNRGLRPTNDQSNAAGFFDRMKQADQILSDPKIAAAGASVTEKAASGVPMLGNALVSDEYQQYDQATRNFLNAVLRKESGAAISEGEFENGRKQYFPQPWDSPKVLAQKAQNRATAIASMSRSAGPAMQGDTNAAQPGPSPDGDALGAARDAISQGADPEAVKQRLIDNGVDPSGL